MMPGPSTSLIHRLENDKGKHEVICPMVHVRNPEEISDDEGMHYPCEATIEEEESGHLLKDVLKQVK